jgi:hypothetical protein
MPHGKSSRVEASQPAEAAAVSNRSLSQAQLHQLRPPDHSMLPISQLADGSLHIASP